MPFRVDKELGNNGVEGPLWNNWCRYRYYDYETKIIVCRKCLLI